MSKCGSQVNLVSNVYGSHYKVPPQKLMKKDKEMKADQERGRWICFLFIVFMTFAFLFVTICIGVVYIQRLQDNMHRLEQRVETLEKALADTPCSCKCEQQETNNIEVRAKRWAGSAESGHEESQHMVKEHHGIPSHRIALLYGDPSLVGRSSDPVEEHQFTIDNSTAARRECGLRYERADGQIWCTARRRRQHSRYMTSRRSHLYDYFAKASWMNRTDSARNYVLKPDGKISVKGRGMYIVHTSVHFTNLANGASPQYDVYKTKEDGTSRTLISKCVIPPSTTSTNAERMRSVFPCQAWQLASLNSGDVVYLSIGSSTWFLVESESFHLALIRLNDNWI